MADTYITFRVDRSALFDTLRTMMGGDPTALGERLVATLLDPRSNDFATNLGLAVYSVGVVDVAEPSDVALVNDGVAMMARIEELTRQLAEARSMPAPRAAERDGEEG